MKENCAIAKAMSALGAAGGESKMGTGKTRPRKFFCGENGCPVIAHIEKGSAGTFHIRTENAQDQYLAGFCKNKWMSQSVEVD